METWTEDICLQLIELYQNNPMIWDPRHEDYFKKNKKFDAWSRISQELGKDVEMCKNKIISLLASYRREKKKEDKSKGTGKGASQVYVSRWFAYNNLKFLDDRNKPRKKLNTEVILSNDLGEEVSNNPGEELSINPDGEEHKQPEPKMPVPPKRPRRLNREGNELIKSAVDVLKNVHSRLDAPREVNRSNSTKAFTDFLASKMDCYSAQTKMALQHAIFEIIMKADMGHYEYSYSQATFPPGYNTSYNTGYSLNQSTTRPPSTHDQYSPSPSTSRPPTTHDQYSTSPSPSTSNLHQPPTSVNTQDTESTVPDAFEDLADYV